MKWANARKFLVALVGVGAEALNAGLLHGTVAQWATGLLALATAIGVYTVPNAPKA